MRSLQVQVPHVALLAFPFTSHGTPMLILAQKLAGMAHDVRFSFFTTSASMASMSEQIAACKDIANLSFHAVPDGLPEGFAFSPQRPEEPVQLFMRSAPDGLRQALAAVPTVSCLISDCFLPLTQDLADELGVPRISFWTAGASSLSVHLYTHLIRDTTDARGLKPESDGDVAVDCIPGLPFLTLQDLPEGVVSGRLDSPFSLLLEDVARTAPRSSAIIVNTFDAFESFSLPAIRNKVPACLFVGPLYRQTETADDHHGCLPFLNSHQPNSVIYVCFGTVVDLLLPKHELVGLAEGLESSGQPFLWSLKPERQADLPAGFVDRVKGRGLLVPWAPQPLVIRHASTAVFFFHVGYNSLLENLVDGVPMICRSAWADNHVNSRLVERVLGTGLRLRGGTCTKESVEEAIRLLLHEGEGKAMREKVGYWKSKAQDAMAPGGSSIENLKALLQILRGAGPNGSVM
ncbi:anthocyanidin 3-O-glucosyltransferase 7-like [Nymphaea colorata]|nr:anthocyanidin 3-O-glucosyltransferase 7-like [Nymphaea colorata]